MARKQSGSLVILRELVSIASRFGPHFLPTRSASYLNKSESRPAQYYRAIDAGEGRSIEKPSEPKSNKDRLVRARLRDILLNQVFHLDLQRAGYSAYAVRLFRVRQRVFQAKALRALDARRVASAIATKTLAEAEALEDWLSVMDLLQLLRNDAALDGDSEAFSRFELSFDNALDIFRATQRAKTAMERFQSVSARSAADNPVLKEALREALAEVEAAGSQHRTFEIQNQALRLRSFIAQVSGNYLSALRICDEAESLLREAPVFQNRARFAEYALKRLVCSIQLRDQEVGREAIEKCTPLFREGENNWYVFKEYQFLFLMHTLHFEEAYHLVIDVVRSPRLRMQSELVQQRLELYRLYAEELTQRHLPTSSLDGLLRLVPDFKKDKVGFNLAVLLLHILVLIERKDKAAVLERIDALKVYRRRYLKDSAHDQADLLVRLLMVLEANDLNVPRACTQIAKLGLSIDAAESHDVLEGIQIVPYDWLWNFLLDRIRTVFPPRG
jgi:hypothetical protein